MKYDDYIKYGSEHACKEAAKFHVVGKSTSSRMAIYCISDLMFK